MARERPLRGVRIRRDHKYDLQLSQAHIDEMRLAQIFEEGLIERIELKSESWQWERTGNIAIEFRREGRPSGLSTTQASCWVHELKRNGETLVYLMFPVPRLKRLARAAIRSGRWRANGGDGKKFDVALIKLSEILR